MNDDTMIDFTTMNLDLRVRLVEAVAGECEGEFEDQDTMFIRAILKIADGTKIEDTADEDAEEDDLDDVSMIARLIDFHWGNFA